MPEAPGSVIVDDDGVEFDADDWLAGDDYAEGCTEECCNPGPAPPVSFTDPINWDSSPNATVSAAAQRRIQALLTRPIIRDDWVVDAPITEERMPDPAIAVDIDVLHYTPTDPGYGGQLRASFQFFRRNAQNRYSAPTLMRLANAAGEFDDRTRQGTEPSPRTSPLLPVLTVASRPTVYDEDTEVKSGGVLGMMVTWPDGKALFAVINGSRRQGIGRQIFNHNRNWTRYIPHFWVGTSNVQAQQFLLAMGLAPTALNGNGAVRYGYSGGEE